MRERAATRNLHRLRLSNQLLLGLGLGVLVGALLLFLISWQPAALLGWDVAAIYFLARTWSQVLPLDAREARDVATREDPGRPLADLILILASVASIAGVGFTLIEAASAKGAAIGALLALAVGSLLSSWLVVHTVFMLRYARLYYANTTGGVSFHQDDPPVYSDFAYFAFTIGMTFQVSDTDIGDREIRAVAIRHALLSYLFGAVLLAMTVNVGASLLK